MRRRINDAAAGRRDLIPLQRVSMIALLLGPILFAAAPARGIEWQRQAPSPDEGDYVGISMISATEAWVTDSSFLAGGTRNLLHTTDGGITWDESEIPSGSSAWAVFFIDAEHGWAAGNGMFHTTDGGETWIQDNGWGSINGLHFVDTQRGWACGNGGVVYKTTNGGLTWTYQTVGSIVTKRSIFFVDAQLGWTTNIDGDIFRTTNGGQSWSLQFASGGSNLGTVQFFDAQEGWAIGGSSFLHTTNGGLSWQAAAVPLGTWVYDAHFIDRQHGWAVGEGGNIVKTTNGGASWQIVQPAGTSPRLWAVRFADLEHGFCAGEACMLYSSADGGESWIQRQSGGPAWVHAIAALEAPSIAGATDYFAWAACEGGEVIRTTNGGAFWSREFVPSFDVYGSVNDIDFVNTSMGWIVGTHSFFGGNLGKVVRTTDGGRTWAEQLAMTIQSMDLVAALDPQTIVVVGNDATYGSIVQRSSNGGQSWFDVSPSAALLGGLDFVDSQTGWLVGGQIYKSTDGGREWMQQHTPSEFLHDVSFADAQHGWAVGHFGTLLHTTNGGSSWLEQDAGVGTNIAFLGVSAVSPSHAWITGGSSFVARTTNGGASWLAEPVLPPSAPSSIECAFFVSEENGWIGGNAGVWRGGATVTTIDPLHVPSPLALDIRPNPGRGDQTIAVIGAGQLREAGPRPEAAALIYDVAGRCVRRLLANSGKENGRFEVVWDGRDASSRLVPAGSYFVRVVNDDQRLSGKIIRR